MRSQRRNPCGKRDEEKSKCARKKKKKHVKWPKRFIKAKKRERERENSRKRKGYV